MEFVILLLVAGLVLFAVRSFRRSSNEKYPSIQLIPLAEMTMPQPPPVKAASPADPPIGVSVAGSPAGSYSIPKAPRDLQNNPATHWVPASQTVDVQTFRISGGMFYLGRGLRSLGDDRVPEPSLIDPTLAIDRGRTNYAGTGVGPWPSYSKLTPQSRAGMLEWLAGGRRYRNAGGEHAGPAYIGYVFIFFYGFERRFFADLQSSKSAHAERIQIIEEVERLRTLYAFNTSFDHYTRAFLEIAYQAVGMSLHDAPPPPHSDSTDIEPRLRIGLGQMAARGLPVPSEWALAWLRSQRDIFLRTPVQRCRDYFEHLFRIRYDQAFPGGLKLDPNTRPLSPEYRPATQSLGHVILKIPTLPDISALAATTSELRMVADQACNELDAYSRWLGRNPESQESLASLSLLPVELVPLHTSSDARKISDFLEGRLGARVTAHFDAEDLLLYWPCRNPPKISKTEATLMAQVLEKIGFGVEPDPRFGTQAPTAGGSVVVFRTTPNQPSAPSEEYAAATLLLHLASMVSSVDEEVSASERETLFEHLTSALHLTDGDRRRLAAHMEWTLSARPGMSGLKKRIAKLTRDQRAGIADFLITVAAADGQISPSEIRVLEKVYKLFGFDREDVYSKVHSITTSGELPEGPREDPATVAEPRSVEGSGAFLDFASVERKLAETAAVASLLGDIFEDEDEPADSALMPPPAIEEIPLRIGPLDEAHSAFLRALCEVEPLWERIELERLAESFTLMTDGALETINDYAFEKAGEPLCEGEDPVEINLDIARELLQ